MPGARGFAGELNQRLDRDCVLPPKMAIDVA